jgi:hypothetical protein
MKHFSLNYLDIDAIKPKSGNTYIISLLNSIRCAEIAICLFDRLGNFQDIVISILNISIWSSYHQNGSYQKSLRVEKY